MLGTSPVSVKRKKRDASYKSDEPSKLTIQELTVELAKTQVSLRSWYYQQVVFTKLLYW